jgi:hypothetical protein
VPTAATHTGTPPACRRKPMTFESEWRARRRHGQRDPSLAPHADAAVRSVGGLWGLPPSGRGAGATAAAGPGGPRGRDGRNGRLHRLLSKCVSPASL